MAFWHEKVRTKGSVILHDSKSKVAVIFSGYDVRQAPLEGHFLRWEGEGAVNWLGWQRNPEGWYELWPHVALFASSSEEMRAKAEVLRPEVESGRLDCEMDRKPYRPPVPATMVREILHATAQAKARIFHVAPKRYLVQYMVYAPEDKYYAASTPSISGGGLEWGLPRKGNETVADDLVSAEEVAFLELNEIVSDDPEIKRCDMPAAAS